MGSAAAKSSDPILGEPATLASLPVRVTVRDLVASRYPHHKRPLDWDARREGIDMIVTAEGDLLKLLSDGGQTPPQAGWVLLISGGDALAGYRWTLYGIPKQS